MRIAGLVRTRARGCWRGSSGRPPGSTSSRTRNGRFPFSWTAPTAGILGAGDRDALGVRPRRPDRRGVRRTAVGRRVGGEGGRAGRARPAREGALRRRRGSVARGARALPPSLPRRGCSFQGDGRPAPSVGNRREARLPECRRRVRVRGRGRARGPDLADAGGSPLGRARSRSGELARVRREQLVAVGSCSFFEPVDELTELGIL